VSFESLLSMRCSVLRLIPTDNEGAATYDFHPIASNVQCRVDLAFLRTGKDTGWTPEAGRPADRQGVAFFLPTAPIRPGDRIKLTQGGVVGTFSLEGNLDQVVDFHGALHHFEVGVMEVAQGG
jgi:hypothetical protein